MAFETFASNLVPDDTNGQRDVFVRDLSTGTTERVSVATNGSQANRDSGSPSISADGQFVAFSTGASLVPDDTNTWSDVYVHDRHTSSTRRVSVTLSGGQGNRGSYWPAISGDGRYVAFTSNAFNLIPGDTNARADIYVQDRQTGTIEWASMSTGGGHGDGDSGEPSISADGRYVAFHSDSSNLVVGDTNDHFDFFVRDRQRQETERVSVASDGTQADHLLSPAIATNAPAISADGRYVAFHSAARNLVPADANGSGVASAVDVFVHDRETRKTERVSVSSSGSEGNGDSFAPSISGDGRYVAYHSDASNIVPAAAPHTDIFVHDRQAGITELVSISSDGVPGNGGSSKAGISADGRSVTFESSASNLVAGDTNAFVDNFVRNRGGDLGVVGDLSVIRSSGIVGLLGRARFSPQVLGAAADPADDSEGGTPTVGAELTGAALIYRPEQEDVLLRLDVSSLPRETGGAPGILYAASFRAGGISYEVRASRMGVTATAPATPHVALYRCAPSCVQHALLAGSFGATGDSVMVSIPLPALEAPEGTSFTTARAFTAVGEGSLGGIRVLDEVPVTSSVIPISRIELGLAPMSHAENKVAYEDVTYPSEGTFSGTMSTAGRPSGAYRAWARACVGEACGPGAWAAVTI